ncbi:MAG: transporter, monovalent cation:proton antiporter-2 family, partial [Labilithrix sp.]|nr:transporter, monovalent cation:proton antiporter-2 family [Labilithrix sp.]
RFTSGHGEHAALVAALGFLLLAGTLLSELVEVVGLPHLTGYLLAGILAGPHVLHLIDHETVERLKPVNTLALSLIALAGGAELKVDTLRRGVKTLISATLAQSILGILLVGVVFFAAHPFIGFTRDLSTGAVVAVALLWGVLAIARSPSAALGVISQTRASGPLAQYTVAFVMASDVVVVVLLAAAITVARPLIDPSLAFSPEAFGALGHEILGSVALGTTLGLVLAIYLRLIGRQLLVVLVALGFGATEILSYLHYDALLTFMVAGFVVQNLSRQGDQLLHGVEQAGSVVYVVFFASAGAHLNVPLLRDLWPVALVLAGSRVLVTFGAGRLASRIAKDDPIVRRWAWAPLVSQAGFAIGIAQIAAREFPSFGRGFGDLAIATVAMNEIVGPILFKVALDRAKETRGPAPSLPDLSDEEPIATPAGPAALPAPADD